MYIGTGKGEIYTEKWSRVLEAKTMIERGRERQRVLSVDWMCQQHQMFHRKL